jgi:HTH-type transcriptional regulator/antitoxin HipB
MRVTLSTADQLAPQIRSLRKARGLTQTELGLLLGVKQARMAEIEADPGAISADQLFRLFHALGARIELDLDDAPAGRVPAASVPGLNEPEPQAYAPDERKRGPVGKTGW